LYGKIISQKSHRVKGKKIFRGIFGAADETDGAEIYDIAVGGAMHADVEQHTAYLQVVHARFGKSVAERILLHDERNNAAAG
jgi:hypothetical protein